MSPLNVYKAVVLAAGRGTRMRATANVELAATQRQAAAAGRKAMMPFGRPFLDYILSTLADAGFTSVCLVVGPGSTDVQSYYASLAPLGRMGLEIVVQSEPVGTANALLPAQAFAGGDLFALINGDNFYPVEALRQLRKLGECGLIGFDRAAMIDGGNISAERAGGYAVLQQDKAGNLVDIIEKPAPAVLATLYPPILLSMNCWLFDGRIFNACRQIAPSLRGEYELPAAVLHTMHHDRAVYRVVQCHKPVWDLSYQTDIPTIGRLLSGREVRL